MSLIKQILESDFVGLKETCDTLISEKIIARVETKKAEVIKKLNEGYIIEGKKTTEKEKDSKEAYFVFPATHKDVTDGKPHFPINTEKEAHAALGYANKYDEKNPAKWYKGSTQKLLDSIVRAVKKRYPDIKISEKGKTAKPNEKK